MEGAQRRRRGVHQRARQCGDEFDALARAGCCRRDARGDRGAAARPRGGGPSAKLWLLLALVIANGVIAAG